MDLNQTTARKSKKQSSSNTEMEEDKENTKKPRIFSAKEFRKQINGTDKLEALKQFLSAVKESTNYDYIVEYLESGGSCLELLQTLEMDSTIQPAIVFELIMYILIKINVTCQKYESAAYESCRYMINNYLTVINKMLNLSSTTPERKACLKLLTSMVTFSPTLAKDILIHVNFHSTNVELLTKHTGEKGSVRDHFIHFLTAFLVDGHYPALSVLLEKKGFITSIISGLQFDGADTLCMVISAMKNYILENPSVSKTAKMKTFNTIVMRDIVNLYNWKGPEALKLHKKNKNITVTVDELEKSKVSKCVHDFLLVLCTSHKFGVIFKDHSLGLGKKNQNALMYTVLESLDRPWEHSYASELVTKICGACPDLAKTMWNNLKPFLEPRLTEKWIKAINFAKILINELQPDCIEFCLKELNVHQFFQIVQCLVAPVPIIKVIVPENHIFESSGIMQNVLSLLLEMLKSLERYLSVAKKYFDGENYDKLKSYISSYVSRHFPDSLTMLRNCDVTKEEFSSELQLLEIIFDIFEKYKNLAPALLDSIATYDNLELSELLTTLDKICEDKEDALPKLQIKIIGIFVHLDQSKFTTNAELFGVVIPLLLKSYYRNKDSQSLAVLHNLFYNTGVFEGCSYEINIWINGILDLKRFDENVASSIADILKITTENVVGFFEELSDIQSDKGTPRDYSDIVQTLINTSLADDDKKIAIKHRYLSPMILGLLKYLNETEVSKSIKTYVNFVLLNLLHAQTQIAPIIEFINKVDILPSHFKEYAKNWASCETVAPLEKPKGKSVQFQQYSKTFLYGNIEEFLQTNQLNHYMDLPVDFLNMSIFYVANLLNNNLLTKSIIENCEKFVKCAIEKNLIDDNFIKIILGHPVLLYNISFIDMEEQKSQSHGTNLLVNCIKYLSSAGYNIQDYLKVYREKLVNTVFRILKKLQKYNLSGFDKILRLFHLSYKETCDVLCRLSNFLKHAPIIYVILVYCLQRIANLCREDLNLQPLSGEIVQTLTAYFVVLCKNQDIDISDLCKEFLEYLKVFPHSIRDLHVELFHGILQRTQHDKNSINLAVFLLERNKNYVNDFKENIELICDKKSLLLPLLQVLVGSNTDNDILKDIYERFEPSLNKVLAKPQKAGQHYQQNYKGLVVLIEKFMPVEKCRQFLDKVHKYEVSEVFHANLIAAVCYKAINSDIGSKQVNNIIMDFVHLQVNLFKRNLKAVDDVSKVNEIASIFNDILDKLLPKTKGQQHLENIPKNETFKLYCRFCLKFGISGQAVLLRTLRNLINTLLPYLEKDDGKLILDMLLSHSEFLENVLGEHSDLKLEILSLVLVLCTRWKEFMERNHVPVFLASYRAMVNKCDRTILTLLKMYETKADQTKFYDFKPYLWGKTAASHYSVRLNIENSLWRQPKMGDVLEILQEDLVRFTIVNYPTMEHLHAGDKELLDVADIKSYDLLFLLPLFSQLLAPEQQVQTYKFTRSGALSLTVIGLSSQNKEVRQAACHVLSRFYFHMDARQSGKDNLLWIRYVEAVCKGTAILPDFRLNNFSAIYLARMALILTQPNHVMYLPLSQHLTAKSSLDFSTVPELYTFLHSSDVNFKERRNFILELLKDGLRTEKDFTDFLRSMAFKLFSELYSSFASDTETKLLILDVTKAICRIPLGVKMSCENHSFLTQIFSDVDGILNKAKPNDSFIDKLTSVLLDIVKVLPDKHTNFMVFSILKKIFNSEYFNFISKETEKVLFEILYLTYGNVPEMFSQQFVNILLNKANDSFCKYLFKYGYDFVDTSSFDAQCSYFYLRLLLVKLKK